MFTWGESQKYCSFTNFSPIVPPFLFFYLFPENLPPFPQILNIFKEKLISIGNLRALIKMRPKAVALATLSLDTLLSIRGVNGYLETD